MANPNVIDYSLFSKPATNSYKPTTNNHHHFIREPDADYNDDTASKIAALLKLPLWPQFPDGAYLNEHQAICLYRIAQAIQGLTHILNRSAHIKRLALDYENQPESPLSELEESQLWAALIEMGNDVVELANDLHCQSTSNI